MPYYGSIAGGYAAGVDANARNNLADINTARIKLENEAARRLQLGDVYAARALKLRADALANAVPPPTAAALPAAPMPGTPSISNQATASGPTVNAYAPQGAPANLTGVPLPAYEKAPPTGFEETANVASQDTEGPGPPHAVISGPGATIGGLASEGEAPTGEEGDSVPRPPGSQQTPLQAVPRPVPPGAINPQTGAPAQSLGQAPMALEMVKYLKQAGAPDEVIVPALHSLNPIFATEYRAEIAGMNAAIRAHQIASNDVWHQGTLEGRKAAIAERGREADQKIEQRERERTSRDTNFAKHIEVWNRNAASREKEVGLKAGANSPDAMELRIVKAQIDKETTNLGQLRNQYAHMLQSDPDRPRLDAQIEAAQRNIAEYQDRIDQIYQRVTGKTPAPREGATGAQTVPEPDLSQQKPSGGNGGWKIEKVQ